MTRLQWISYAQILFNQLEQVNKNNQLCVNLKNYISALNKLLPLLPLQEYFQGGEKVISFAEVRGNIEKLKGKFVNLDQIIDAFMLICDCKKKQPPKDSILLVDREKLIEMKCKDLSVRWSDSDSDDDCEIKGSLVEVSAEP